jgi:hypothetical protein
MQIISDLTRSGYATLLYMANVGTQLVDGVKVLIQRLLFLILCVFAFTLSINCNVNFTELSLAFYVSSTH